MRAKYFEEDMSDMREALRQKRFGHPGLVRNFGSEDCDEHVFRDFAGWQGVDLASMIPREELEARAIPLNAKGELTGMTIHFFIKPVSQVP